jgi:hypothetical protein
VNTTVASGATTLGARLSLESVHPAVCLPLAGRAMAACLGGQVGAIQATGSGVPLSGQGGWWWVAPTASIGARLSLTRAFGVWARLDVGALLYRRSFVFENVGSAASVQVYEPSPVFATLSLEPELRFFATDSTEARHVHR